METHIITKLYKQGLTLEAIAKRVGFRSHVSVGNYLTRMGVTKRTKAESMRGRRNALKHKCDEDFFRCVRGQRQAYLLGLLIADGCVCTTDGYKLSFSSVDRQLVDHVKACLKATHPITEHGGSWEITVSSEKLVRQLSRYGCAERKSLTATWSELPKALYPHYIRGLFDGDGGVWIDKNNTARCMICGTLHVITALGKLFKAEPHRHGSIWKLEFSGNHRVADIGRYLYQGASFSLDRKRIVFQSIKTKYLKIPMSFG